MSPVVKQKGDRFVIPSRYLLFLLSAICLLLMIITYRVDAIGNFFSTIAGGVVVPFEKGISGTGSYLNSRKEQLQEINDLLEENAKLKEQVDSLTIENTKLQQDRYELNSLRNLFELSADYDQFETTGARVITRSSGNWFYSFAIDKGSSDGIEVDMNVMAGSGLVGRIVSVGPNWSKVKAIIADDSNVSAMTLASSDLMIVSGSLEEYASGRILFSQMMNAEDRVRVGDKVVTSTISDKYLPGILIGYIDEINPDANNLTMSGTITPAVDFAHIDEVLVILKQKEVIEEEESEE